jgi:hypothetical protein
LSLHLHKETTQVQRTVQNTARSLNCAGLVPKKKKNDWSRRPCKVSSLNLQTAAFTQELNKAVN